MTERTLNWDNPKARQIANPARFPNGMKALADHIHSKGLKFGACVPWRVPWRVWRVCRVCRVRSVRGATIRLAPFLPAFLQADARIA